MISFSIAGLKLYGHKRNILFVTENKEKWLLENLQFNLWLPWKVHHRRKKSDLVFIERRVYCKYHINDHLHVVKLYQSSF
jgi:hypothetical protein